MAKRKSVRKSRKSVRKPKRKSARKSKRKGRKSAKKKAVNKSKNRHSPSVEKKRKDRPSPSISAAENPNMTAEGNDGNMWVSKKSGNSYRWMKVKVECGCSSSE